MFQHRRTFTRITAILGTVAASVVLAGAGATSAQADDGFLPRANISVDAAYQPIGGTATVTASAEFIYIPGTKYYVMLKDMTSNVVLNHCAVNTCPAVVTQYVATTHNFRAYVRAFDGSYEDSTSLNVTWQRFVLDASSNYADSGTYVTLTARSQSAGQITIKDKTTGVSFPPCPGSPCSVSVMNYKSQHTYVATQAGRSYIAPASNDETVLWTSPPA